MVENLEIVLRIDWLLLFQYFLWRVLLDGHRVHLCLLPSFSFLLLLILHSFELSWLNWLLLICRLNQHLDGLRIIDRDDIFMQLLLPFLLELLLSLLQLFNFAFLNFFIGRSEVALQILGDFVPKDFNENALKLHFQVVLLDRDQGQGT